MGSRVNAAASSCYSRKCHIVWYRVVKPSHPFVRRSFLSIHPSSHPVHRSVTDLYHPPGLQYNSMKCNAKLEGTRRQTPVNLLVDSGKQLRLQNELSFLVLLGIFVRLIVLPSHHVLALATDNVPDDMAARGHVALAGLARLDVDDRVEEVGFSMLASEVLFFSVSDELAKERMMWNGVG